MICRSVLIKIEFYIEIEEVSLFSRMNEHLLEGYVLYSQQIDKKPVCNIGPGAWLQKY